MGSGAWDKTWRKWVETWRGLYRSGDCRGGLLTANTGCIRKKEEWNELGFRSKTKVEIGREAEIGDTA